MLKTNVADALMGANAAISLAGSVQTSTAANQTKNGASFADTFNSATDKNVKAESNQNVKAGTTNVVATNKPVKEAEDNQAAKPKESLGEDEKVSAVKEITKGAEKVVQEIKEKYDVTDDDINEAMELLGLTFEDLFNVKDLQNLLMTITGTTDSVELLTNVELYDGMNEMISFMNEVKEGIESELNISEDVFVNTLNDKDLFEKVMNEIPEKKSEVLPKEMAGETKDMFEETNVTDEMAVNTATVSDVKTENINEPVVNADDKAVSEKETVISTEKPEREIKVEVNVNTEDKVDTVNGDAVKKILQDDFKDQNNNSFNNKNEKNDNLQNETMVSFTEVTVENTVGDVVEVVQSYSDVSTAESVMKQITDYVKVNISSDETSMEMRLHPASLGTVNMQVLSQNGEVTARFTVQNEAVKSILENQLVSLQETLNEAGTKVSAIEVTVANYNLDKGMDNNSGEANGDKSQKGSKRRNINLNGLTSYDELDEEELIEAKVMEMNGNTVNFRA